MKLDDRVTYEGFGRRLLAGLIDVAFLSLLAATVMVGEFLIRDESAYVSEFVSTQFANPIHAAWWLGAVGLALMIFWKGLGATPGMLLVGCQVVRADNGRRLSLLQSFVRSIGLLLGLACLGLGVLWCIRDRRHQGLHDKLAGSVVVREDESLMTLAELVEGVK